MDKVVTRWLKRHLHRLDAGMDLSQHNSLTEHKDMLAENIDHWREPLINEGKQAGRQEGRQEGRTESRRETARNLIRMNILTDRQFAEATALSLAEIQALRAGMQP